MSGRPPQVWRRRRCFWYEDDGRPRQRHDGILGCDEGSSCGYAHPDDIEWARASRSHPPPWLINYSRVNYADPPRERTPHRSTTPDTSSPGRPSAQVAGSYRPPKKQESNESMHYSYRRDDLPPGPRGRSPPRASTSYDTRDFGRAVPTGARRSVDRKEGPLTPPPLAAAPLPVPAPHTSSSIISSKESDTSERMSRWVARIKLLGDAVNTRVEYLKIEQDVTSFKQMKDSPRYFDASEEVKDRLTRQLAELERQWDVKKSELNTHLYRLLDTDFWPVSHVAPESATTDEKFHDMRVLVWELRDNVVEIQKMMQISAGVSSSEFPESTIDNTPAMKRRRVFEAEAVEIKKSSTPVIAPGTSVVAAARPAELSDGEINKLYARFEKIDTKLSELENNMVQLDNEMLAQMHDDVEEQVDKKLGTLKLNPVAAAPDTSQSLREENDKLWEAASGFDKDIRGLVDTALGLLNQTAAADQEILNLKTENATLKQQIASLEQQQQETARALKEQQMEMRSLSAALATFIAQPARVPEPPDLAPILDTLGPSLCETVRQDIQPLLSEMHKRIEDMLAEQSNELSTSVFTKLSTTLQTVQTISKWIDSIVKTAQLPNASHLANPSPFTNGVHANLTPVVQDEVHFPTKSA